MANSPGSNDVSTLNGLFKQVYADRMERLIPDGKKVITNVPFVARDKQPGATYNQPVVLNMEHGVTYAAPDEGAFELLAPISGQIKNATVEGYQMVLRSALSYQAAARAAGGGARAFEDATKFLVGNMMDSVTKRLEISLIYGQVGIGEVDAAGATAGANVVVPIEPSEFAPGIWAGAEKMLIDVVRGGTLLAGASGANALEVKSADLTAKTITVTTLGVNLLANDVLKPKGAHDKEMKGIHSILSTSTGLLFGIQSADYSLWRGTTFSPSTTSVLSFAILQQAISKAVEKGLESDVLVMVNPGHWDDLLTEQAALRVYDSSYKRDEMENGAKTIKFHGQNGMIEITPSIYVKEGYAYVLCLEDWARIGSTDVTFKRPGQGEDFFLDLPSYAGYEMRCYTDQAIFCAKPGRSVLISNLKVS